MRLDYFSPFMRSNCYCFSFIAAFFFINSTQSGPTVISISLCPDLLISSTGIVIYFGFWFLLVRFHFYCQQTAFSACGACPLFYSFIVSKAQTTLSFIASRSVIFLFLLFASRWSVKLNSSELVINSHS